MSTSVTGVTTNFFPSAENGFTTTTSGSVSSGAATVGLNSVAGYTNGEVVALVIDPTDATKKQTFTGVVDTAGSQITSVVWTAGTNQTHALGATVVDYATATHISMMTKGILQFAEQTGALKTTAVRTALGLGSDDLSGWEPLGTAPTAVTHNGNRSYDLTFSSTMAATLSPGMRLRTTRTAAAPTQCADLESSSTQYFSKTSPAGMTFTDDFVVSAWVKIESYPTAAIIASRYNGTSGWYCYVDSTGRIHLTAHNGGSGNYTEVTSYQSLPLGKWVHVAVQLDMSTAGVSTTTSYVMLDGVDVPCTKATAGTMPTALVQAGNFEVGSYNGGTSPFDGKLAQVAIYSAKVTQATIKAAMNQSLAGTETSLISAYSFNNTLNDLNTTNANNLTANGGALATNADSPFGGQGQGTISSTLDYGIVTKVATTTVTVQVSEGNTIPTSGGVTSVVYSTHRNPFGFSSNRGKWVVETLILSGVLTKGGATNDVWYNGGIQLTIPVGEWVTEYSGSVLYQHGSTANATALASLSTATNTEGDIRFRTAVGNTSTAYTQYGTPVSVSNPMSVTTLAPYYLNQLSHGGTGTINLWFYIDSANQGQPAIIRAESAYV